MFTVHHDAIMLPVNLKCADYIFQNDKLPAINASASVDRQGQVHLFIVNLDPTINQQVVCTVHGKAVGKVTDQVITADKMNDFNDFGQAEKVSLRKFADFKVQKNEITVTMPSKSIVMLEIE